MITFIYLSIITFKKKVTTILPQGIGPLPTQPPQVRWRKRQDVPENLRNGHWQVPRRFVVACETNHLVKGTPLKVQ